MRSLVRHAGIYDKTCKPYKLICSGSLISTTAVLSAAHCFWKDGEGLQPAENYAVTLGKIYIDWASPNDKGDQRSDIKEIHIPPEFHNAETHFQYDIAYLKLHMEIKYNKFIRPVRINFKYTLKDKQLQPGNLGTVAGWGLTSPDGNDSLILQVVKLPYVSHQQCYDESPPDFRKYLTGDKICAGYLNGTALCKGDSGGGLAFPETLLDVQRFYLRGIASTAPKNDQECDPYQRTTFTDISKHEHFIREHE